MKTKSHQGILVRNERGTVKWQSARKCASWSIEGGTVIARDDKGQFVEAYQLSPGDTVETA